MDRHTPALHEMQCINYGFIGDLYLYLAHNTGNIFGNKKCVLDSVLCEL